MQSLSILFTIFPYSQAQPREGDLPCPQQELQTVGSVPPVTASEHVLQSNGHLQQTPNTNPYPSIQAVQTLGDEQVEQLSVWHFTHSDVKVLGSLTNVIGAYPGSDTHSVLI